MGVALNAGEIVTDNNYVRENPMPAVESMIPVCHSAEIDFVLLCGLGGNRLGGMCYSSSQ
jgi:hypothetical protein